MRTFAFLPSNSIARECGSRVEKYTKHIGIRDIAKISVLVFFILFAGFIYLYYINLASTRWYFLRQENQKLSTLSFKNDILTTNVLKYQKYNRDELHEANNNIDRIEIIQAQIVQVPVFEKTFAMNSQNKTIVQ